jgi:hypothetical protein
MAVETLGPFRDGSRSAYKRLVAYCFSPKLNLFALCSPLPAPYLAPNFVLVVYSSEGKRKRECPTSFSPSVYTPSAMEYIHSGLLITMTPKLTIFSSKTGSKIWKSPERINCARDFANRSLWFSENGIVITCRNAIVTYFWVVLSPHAKPLLEKWKTRELRNLAPDAVLSLLAGGSLLAKSVSQKSFQLYSDGQLLLEKSGTYQYQLPQMRDEPKLVTIATMEGRFHVRAYRLK